MNKGIIKIVSTIFVMSFICFLAIIGHKEQLENKELKNIITESESNFENLENENKQLKNNNKELESLNNDLEHKNKELENIIISAENNVEANNLINKLGKCPFCYQKDITIHHVMNSYSVECNECGIRTGYFSSHNELIEYWGNE